MEQLIAASKRELDVTTLWLQCLGGDPLRSLIQKPYRVYYARTLGMNSLLWLRYDNAGCWQGYPEM